MSAKAPWLYAVAMGKIGHVSQVEMVGRNPDIDTGTLPETIWPAGGTYSFRSAAAICEVVSSDAADDGDPVGTGARTIRIYGLDEDFNEISEDITLNGVTAVDGVLEFLRINRVEVLTAGSGGTNAGTITVRDNGAGTTRATIGIARGRSEMAVYTVPADKTLLMEAWIASASVAGAGSETQVDVLERRNAGSVSAAHVAWSFILSGGIESPFKLPHVFPEKTDIEWRAVAAANSNTVVDIHAHGVLVGPYADL